MVAICRDLRATKSPEIPENCYGNMTLELISDEAGGLWTTGACRCSRGIVAKGDYARGSVRIRQVCLDKKAVTGVDDIKIYCEQREAARGYTFRHNRCGL